MKKILIWGTGDIFMVNWEQINRLQNEKYIQIEALVSKEAQSGSMIKGIPVIKKEDVLTYSFDQLIIAAATPAYESIMEDVQSLNIQGDKIASIHDLLLEYIFGNKQIYQEILDKQVKVLKELLTATDDEVCSYEWMYNKVNEYGIYSFRAEEKRDFSNELSMMQIVEEFTNFCLFISQLEIKDAIEIGVFRGRSSYFVCALLSRKNPDLKYICVDICDVLDSFECFKEILPALEKRIPSTSNDYVGQSFDYVFIDADHSYEGSIKDYMNLGRYAKKVVAFHDIYAHEYDYLDGGTVRTWKEVLNETADKEHKIFSKYPDEWMGIGCVLM